MLQGAITSRRPNGNSLVLWGFIGVCIFIVESLCHWKLRWSDATIILTGGTRGWRYYTQWHQRLSFWQPVVFVTTSGVTRANKVDLMATLALLSVNMLWNCIDRIITGIDLPIFLRFIISVDYYFSAHFAISGCKTSKQCPRLYEWYVTDGRHERLQDLVGHFEWCHPFDKYYTGSLKVTDIWT